MNTPFNSFLKQSSFVSQIIFPTMSKNRNKKRKDVVEDCIHETDGIVMTIEKLWADVAMLNQYKTAVREGISRLKAFQTERLQRLSDLSIVDEIKKPDNFRVEKMTARELVVTFTPRSGEPRLIRRKYIDGKVVYSKSQSFGDPKYWVYERNESALYADAYAKFATETAKKHPEAFDADKVIVTDIDTALAALCN